MKILERPKSGDLMVTVLKSLNKDRWIRNLIYEETSSNANHTSGRTHNVVKSTRKWHIRAFRA